MVWNLNVKKLQILEITQSTILKPLQELVSNEDWGDPRAYSITITKKGEKLETEYTLVPSPAKETPADVLKQYQEANIDLDVLFTGGDPFNAVESSEIEPVEEGDDTAF